MRNVFILLLTGVVVLSIVSCKQQKSSAHNEHTVVEDSSSKEPLYPYPQYIQSQIAYLDSVPLGIEKIVYENGVRTDSGFISREQFKELAKEFLEPDPNIASLRNQYTESSFNDLSLNSITFTITSKNPENVLQQADILLNPENKEVKYIIIKKQAQEGDIKETKSLMWIHNMNFRISTSTIDDDGKESKKEVKVVWDKPMQ